MCIPITCTYRENAVQPSRPSSVMTGWLAGWLTALTRSSSWFFSSRWASSCLRCSSTFPCRSSACKESAAVRVLPLAPAVRHPHPSHPRIDHTSPQAPCAKKAGHKATQSEAQWSTATTTKQAYNIEDPGTWSVFFIQSQNAQLGHIKQR